MSEFDATDLETLRRRCGEEPIHLCGAIQPHGYFIACSLPHWRIQHYSANCAELFGSDGDSLLQRTLDELIGVERVHDFSDQLSMGGEEQPARLIAVPLFGDERLFDVHLRYAWRTVFVELERRQWPAVSHDPSPALQAMIGRVMGAADVDDYCHRLADEIRRLVLFDRVLVHRFFEDYSGEVVAEAGRLGEDGPMVGIRFPASDIPPQARRLYLENWIRVIPDASYVAVPILPPPLPGEALDLSHAQLRSVSPVHLQYLRNMGAGASMSISLICGGRLWGLIACHNAQTQLPPLETRLTAELFGLTASMQLELLLRREASLEEARQREVLAALAAPLAPSVDPFEVLGLRLESLLQLVPCNGAGVLCGNEWMCLGEGMPTEATRALIAHAEGLSEDLFHTRRLQDEVPQIAARAPEVCGLMIAALRLQRPIYLVWWRGEWRHEVTWAGEPAKSVSLDGQHLSPRASFAAWAEIVRGHSRAWTAADIDSADRARRILMLELARHHQSAAVAQGAEASRIAQRQRELAKRLSMQVERMLTIGEPAHPRGSRAERSLGRFLKGMRDRIIALADSAVIRDRSMPVDIREVVRDAVGALAGSGETFSLEGPPLWLAPEAAATIGAALSELAIDAYERNVAHQPEARIHLEWQAQPSDGWRLLWTERSASSTENYANGPSFSRVIVLHAPQFELQGSSRLWSSSTGLQAEFIVPGRFCTEEASISDENGPHSGETVPDS